MLFNDDDGFDKLTNRDDNDDLGCRVIEGPNMVCYTNNVEEELFKVGFCLPAGPYVSDEDVKYIVECIKEAIA